MQGVHSAKTAKGIWPNKVMQSKNNERKFEACCGVQAFKVELRVLSEFGSPNLHSTIQTTALVMFNVSERTLCNHKIS